LKTVFFRYLAPVLGEGRAVTRAPKSRGSGDPSSLERWLKHPPSNA
jgi:hypothetical protein